MNKRFLEMLKFNAIVFFVFWGLSSIMLFIFLRNELSIRFWVIFIIMGILGTFFSALFAFHLELDINDKEGSIWNNNTKSIR